MQEITYQRKNGDIIKKYRYTGIKFKIGETNGFGWKVKDIKYLYKGKYLPIYEYNRLSDKEWKRFLVFNEFKKNIKKINQNLSYCMIPFILIKIITLISKI